MAVPSSIPVTVFDSLLSALQKAADYNRDDTVPPAAVLWPDEKREWEKLASRLRGVLPQFLTFGPYDATHRTGPAIWLRCVLAGERPYDIFVRWKPLHEQAIGWHPDVNDGVRVNIRPFIEADILRKPPNIKWTKDRGKEPARDAAEYPWFNAAGDRVNDIHLTNSDKMAARAANEEKS